MATVFLPRSLVVLLPDVPRTLAVEAMTVAQLIDGLEARFPGMRDRLCESGPRIRPFINVFVDGQRAELDTPTPAGSVVHVIPAVAGGARSEGRVPDEAPARVGPGPASRCSDRPVIQTEEERSGIVREGIRTEVRRA